MTAEAIPWALNPEQGTQGYESPVWACLRRSVKSDRRRRPRLTQACRSHLAPEPDSRGAGLVSIAVMNWVWLNSPTSGNERLVLLSLLARGRHRVLAVRGDDRPQGQHQWPYGSPGDRPTEVEGHDVVHRGGGRAGSTNSYTVVTCDRVIHSPGQDATPDILSGGDTDDRLPLTQPCQGTPDTAVSADPPKNHQGTTPHAGARLANPCPARPTRRRRRSERSSPPLGGLADDCGATSQAHTRCQGRARRGVDAPGAGVGHWGERRRGAEPVRGAGRSPVAWRTALAAGAFDTVAVVW